MSCNGWGEHATTRERIMAEHDALPAELRFLSCNTVGKWSADSFEQLYDRGCILMGPHTAVAFTARMIARMEAEDTLRTYGPAHPESPASDRS